VEFYQAEPEKVWRHRLWLLLLGAYAWMLWKMTVGPLINLLNDGISPVYGSSGNRVNWLNYGAHLPLLLAVFFLLQSPSGHFLRTALSRLNTRWNIALAGTSVLGLTALVIIPILQANKYYHPIFGELQVLWLLPATALIIALAPVPRVGGQGISQDLGLWREAVRLMTLGVFGYVLLDDGGSLWLGTVATPIARFVLPAPFFFSFVRYVLLNGLFLAGVALLAFPKANWHRALVARLTQSRAAIATAAVLAFLLTRASIALYFQVLPSNGLAGIPSSTSGGPVVLVQYVTLAGLMMLLAPKPTHAFVKTEA
jgi:hypothetical protein